MELFFVFMGIQRHFFVILFMKFHIYYGLCLLLLLSDAMASIYHHLNSLFFSIVYNGNVFISHQSLCCIICISYFIYVQEPLPHCCSCVCSVGGCQQMAWIVIKFID